MNHSANVMGHQSFVIDPSLMPLPVANVVDTSALKSEEEETAAEDAVPTVDGEEAAEGEGEAEGGDEA
jgi:hypothetical protein